MANQKTRIECIDLAKGIGIMLVVLGHLMNPEGQYERNVIFSFHMPLFFMLSGIFAENKKGFSNGLKKIFSSIYVPYIVFVLLDALLRLLVNFKNGSPDVKKLTVHTLKCAMGFERPYYNIAIWFLFALFVIKTIFLFVNLIKNNIAKNTVIAVLSAGCIIFILLRSSMDLPKNILFISAIPGFLFFCFGYVLRKVWLSLASTRKSNVFYAASVILFVAFALTCPRVTGMVDMRVYNYSDYPILYLVNAITGCFLMMCLCSALANTNGRIFTAIKKPLLFFGENSIIILLTHYYFARRLPKLLYERFGIEEYLYRRSNELLLFVLIMLLMVPMIWFFNKYLYALLGKKKPQKEKSSE